MKSFTKDTISVGVSKLLIIVFQLITVVVVARVLGPDANGLIAGLTVYPALFMTVGPMGIRQSTAYFLANKKYSLEAIKVGVVQMWVATSIISLICCYLLVRHLSSSGNELSMVLLAIAPIPFSLFCSYNSGIFLGKNDVRSFNRTNWLPPMFVALSTLLLVFLLGWGIEGALISTFVGQLFLSALLFHKHRFLESFSMRLDVTLIKDLVGLGSVYAIALLVITLNYKADIILLDHLSSPSQLGYYSKGARLMEFLWQIPKLFSIVVFARSAVAKDKDAFSVKVAVLLRLSLIVVGLVSICLAIISPQLIFLLFGIEFLPSATVLRVLLPGVVLLTIFKVMNMDLAGRGKPWISIYAMLPALLLNIGLNLWLIPSHGANGAAFASTISYSVAAIIFLHFYCKQTNLSFWKIFVFRKSDFEMIRSYLGGRKGP